MVAQRKGIQLVTMRLRVGSPASLTGLRIRRCQELGCRSQMHLGSGVAVTVADGCSSDWTPSLGTSICRESGPRNGKKTKKKKNSRGEMEVGGQSSIPFTLGPKLLPQLARVG